MDTFEELTRKQTEHEGVVHDALLESYIELDRLNNRRSPEGLLLLRPTQRDRIADILWDVRRAFTRQEELAVAVDAEIEKAIGRLV